MTLKKLFQVVAKEQFKLPERSHDENRRDIVKYINLYGKKNFNRKCDRKSCVEKDLKGK